MKKQSWIIAAVLICTVMLVGGCTSTQKDKIVVGGRNFTEQHILVNMYADLIEAHTDLEVERRLGLGGSFVSFNAMVADELDVTIEYTGTLLINILEQEFTNDPEECYEVSKRILKEEYNLELLEPMGFNNTYTLSMMPDVAEMYNIEKISDLEDYADEFVLSPTIEFEIREDGLVGLQREYGFEFENIKAMDGSLRYTALDTGDAQVTDAFSTDGLIKKFDLKILEDDKNFFVPYHAVPLVRGEILEEYPELEEVLNMLAGEVDEETMIELNYRVDELGERPEDVANDFLTERGLI